ncbi:hypothetical protein BKA67DRAFT_581681 [Truncatella angustata]|uniref:Uncharacterized protein n=1 Tax=Truncatella angustata TaxID=152316 RepID=A0A9P8UDB7_9PEZI|nr:uncharacterized protein BKA67DRAFT_581681 [Truncatella angustata]KAH6647107.1 hypothetical protein BKA67DRAFT_581681 [Truncatella angustata]
MVGMAVLVVLRSPGPTRLLRVVGRRVVLGNVVFRVGREELLTRGGVGVGIAVVGNAVFREARVVESVRLVDVGVPVRAGTGLMLKYPLGTVMVGSVVFKADGVSELRVDCVRVGRTRVDKVVFRMGGREVLKIEDGTDRLVGRPLIIVGSIIWLESVGEVVGKVRFSEVRVVGRPLIVERLLIWLESVGKMVDKVRFGELRLVGRPLIIVGSIIWLESVGELVGKVRLLI